MQVIDTSSNPSCTSQKPVNLRIVPVQTVMGNLAVPVTSPVLGLVIQTGKHILYTNKYH